MINSLIISIGEIISAVVIKKTKKKPVIIKYKGWWKNSWLKVDSSCKSFCKNFTLVELELISLFIKQ